MAKFLSQVYTVIRGSVGGVTYLAGPHHALIARARVAPVNPGTTWQNYIRAAWANKAASWQGLTDAVRRNWGLYALTVQFQSPTGPYTVTGRSLFTAWKATGLYVANRGFATWTTTAAPTTPGALLQAAVTLDAALATPGIGRLLYVDNPNTTKVTFYIEASPPQSAIRNTFKGPFDSGTMFGSAIVAAGANIGIPITGLVSGAVYFARIGTITTGIDSPGAVPCKVAQPTIYRFVATTTV